MPVYSSFESSIAIFLSPPIHPIKITRSVNSLKARGTISNPSGNGSVEGFLDYACSREVPNDLEFLRLLCTAGVNSSSIKDPGKQILGYLR